MLDVVMHLSWCSFSLPIACRDACSFLCWLQDTFLLPNLQTKSNDRMLVTRVQPGPFSGYDSATKGTAVGNNGLKWVLACASVSGPQNLSSILCKIQGASSKLPMKATKDLYAGILCFIATSCIMKTPAAQQWHNGEPLILVLPS